MRPFLLAANLVWSFLVVTTFHVSDHVIYMTQWGNNLVTVHLLLATMVAHGMLSCHRVVQVTFQIAFSVEILITSVFWGILYHVSQDEIKAKGLDDFTINMIILLHVFPMVFIALEWAVSKYRFRTADSLYFNVFGVFYIGINYVATLM